MSKKLTLTALGGGSRWGDVDETDPSPLDDRFEPDEEPDTNVEKKGGNPWGKPVAEAPAPVAAAPPAEFPALGQEFPSLGAAAAPAKKQRGGGGGGARGARGPGPVDEPPRGPGAGRDRYGGGDRFGGGDDRYGDRGDRGGDRGGDFGGRDRGFGGHGGGGGGFGRDFGDRDPLPSKPRGGAERVDDIPLPERPPYTAHVGQLAYSCTEADLRDLFADCGIKTVRLPMEEGTDRIKGFGYVEFTSLDGLKSALALHGEPFLGRTIRVSVAAGRAKGVDQTPDNWRSGMGAAAEREPRGGTFGRDRGGDRGGFGGDRGRGFGGDRGDRDRGFGGDRDRGFGGDRDRGFGGDRGDRDRGFGGDRDRGFGGDRNDRDRGFGGDRGDRDRGFGGDRERGGGAGGAPRVRQKLQLAPRTVDASKEEEVTPKPDIFGGAKARDELAIQRKKEEEREARLAAIEAERGAPAGRDGGDRGGDRFGRSDRDRGGRGGGGRGAPPSRSDGAWTRSDNPPLGNNNPRAYDDRDRGDRRGRDDDRRSSPARDNNTRASAPPAAKEKKKEEPKVANVFAALELDADD